MSEQMKNKIKLLAKASYLSEGEFVRDAVRDEISHDSFQEIREIGRTVRD